MKLEQGSEPRKMMVLATDWRNFLRNIQYTTIKTNTHDTKTNTHARIHMHLKGDHPAR